MPGFKETIINNEAKIAEAAESNYPTEETFKNIKTKLVDEDKLEVFFEPDIFDFEIPEEIKNSIIEALKERIKSQETSSLCNFDPFSFQYNDQYFDLEFLCNKDESVAISIKSRNKDQLKAFLKTYSNS